MTGPRDTAAVVAGRGSLPSVRLALTTFTVAPVRSEPPTPTTAGRSMLLAPAIGVLLGTVAAAVLLVARLATSPGATTPLLPAVLAVVVLALLTRGLHLDGLADTADGLGSMLPAERAREVMRQPDIGPFGVTALLLVLLVQVAALTSATVQDRGPAAVLLAVVAGRLAVTLACTPATPAASPDGLGAVVAGTVRGSAAFAATSLVLVAAAMLGGLDDAGAAGWSALRCVAAVLAGLVVAHLLRAHAVRRVGGITGDVLGAIVEVTTAVVLVVMAV